MPLLKETGLQIDWPNSLLKIKMRYIIFVNNINQFTLKVIMQVPYEFRAVWVASVANISWPSQPGLDSEDKN